MYSRWRGSGVQEEGFDEKTGKVVVKVDPRYFRPAEVELVAACPSRRQRVLTTFISSQPAAWQPCQSRKEARLETHSGLPLAGAGDGRSRFEGG